MNTFSVKNFDKFQHYKDRSPPWIKFYNDLLDDYEFGRLPDASKWHIAAIWLLASRSDNKIPYDPEWVSRRINAASTVDLDRLADAGFIVVNQEVQSTEQNASGLQAKRLTRERAETEGETEKRRTTFSDENVRDELFQDNPPTAEGSNQEGELPPGELAEFWKLAKSLEGRKVARSRCGELLKYQSLDEALDTLKATAKAREPSRYLGKIIDTLRKERAGTGPPKNGKANGAVDAPPWVIERWAEGDTITREGRMWRWGAGLYNDAGDQIGF